MEKIGYAQPVASSIAWMRTRAIKFGPFFYLFLFARCADVGLLAMSVRYWRRIRRNISTVGFFGERPNHAALLGLALGIAATVAFGIYDVTIGKLIGQAMGGWRGAGILPMIWLGAVRGSSTTRPVGAKT